MPVTMRADSLTLFAETGENSFALGDCTSSSTPTASCTGGLSATATGSLSKGTVGVKAGGVAPLPNILNQTNWVATAQGGIEYNYAVSGVLNGTIITTLIEDGTTSASPSGIAEATISIPNTESFKGMGSTTSFLLPNGTFTVKIVTPVSAGTADFSFDLSAYAECPPESLATGATCNATADYLDPATVASVTVYDASGKSVPGATLLSESGFSPRVTTPEPSLLVLLGTGLLAVAGLGRRKWLG
jgi:hypothetical protein